MSAYSSFRALSGVPTWPVVMLVRSSTGRVVPLAWSRAANLNELLGATRGSLTPVRSNVEGYLVPSCTWWYGGEAPPELGRIAHRAVLGRVEEPVRAQLRSQHVVDADLRHHDAGEVRVLRELGAHQQAAIAPTHDGQAIGRRVAPVHERLRAGGEVVEHVLLGQELARLVPCVAVLAAAADVRHRVDAALLDPEHAAGLEIGLHADAVAAVAVEEERCLAVERHALPDQDAHWNTRAIAGRDEFAPHFHAREVGGGLERERRRRNRVRGRVVPEPAPRLGVAL